MLLSDCRQTTGEPDECSPRVESPDGGVPAGRIQRLAPMLCCPFTTRVLRAICTAFRPSISESLALELPSRSKERRDAFKSHDVTRLVHVRLPRTQSSNPSSISTGLAARRYPALTAVLSIPTIDAHFGTQPHVKSRAAASLRPVDLHKFAFIKGSSYNDCMHAARTTTRVGLDMLRIAVITDQAAQQYFASVLRAFGKRIQDVYARRQWRGSRYYARAYCAAHYRSLSTARPVQ